MNTNCKQLIRAEIERQLEYFKGKEDDAWDDCDNYTDEDAWWYQGHWKMCAKLLAFIDSLPDEQPSKDLDEELNKWRHIHFDGERDGDFSGEWLMRTTQLKFAQHFYELGQHSKIPASKDLEEAANNYISPIENEQGLSFIGFSGQDIKDAFIAGAEWQKDQMLKDAVECELYRDGDCLTIDLDMEKLGHTEDDKVKVIIVKEGEK